MKNALKTISYFLISALIGFICGATISNILVGLSLCFVFIFGLVCIYAIDNKLYCININAFEDLFSEFKTESDIKKYIEKPFVFNAE